MKQDEFNDIEGMTPQELEAELRSKEHEQISGLLKQLPKREPSLAWRSSLSERLLKEAAKHRKTRRAFPALAGFATVLGAAAVFLALTVTRAPQNGSESAVAQMVRWHEEAAAATVLPADSASLDGFSTLPKGQFSNNSDELLYGGSVQSL